VDANKDKPSSSIKKSTAITAEVKKSKPSGGAMKLSEAKRVLARKKRHDALTNKIRKICHAKTVLPLAPMLSLCRAATRRSVGNGVRIQAKAMVGMHNSVETLIVDVITAAKNYIPRNQKTVQLEHIMKALELPEFREPFRIIDGRMKLHEPKKRAIKAATS
jgi:histone H3/H4